MEVRNRFKGLDLIDRVPDELWTKVCDIVQETGIKTIPKKNKFKKANWLSEAALQVAVKRREAKSKGEKERYTHLNHLSCNIISNTPKIRMLLRHSNSYAKVYAFKTSINIIQKKKKPNNNAGPFSHHCICNAWSSSMKRRASERADWWPPGNLGQLGWLDLEAWK